VSADRWRELCHNWYSGRDFDQVLHNREACFSVGLRLIAVASLAERVLRNSSIPTGGYPLRIRNQLSLLLVELHWLESFRRCFLLVT